MPAATRAIGGRCRRAAVAPAGRPGRLTVPWYGGACPIARRYGRACPGAQGPGRRGSWPA